MGWEPTLFAVPALGFQLTGRMGAFLDAVEPICSFPGLRSLLAVPV